MITTVIIIAGIFCLSAGFFMASSLDAKRDEEVVYAYLESRLRHPSQRHYHPENDYEP